MSVVDRLNREVKPVVLAKALAGALAGYLLLALVFQGIPSGIRHVAKLKRENETRARMRRKYSVPGKTAAIGAQNMVTRDITDNNGERVFRKPVEVARIHAMRTVQDKKMPDHWTVSGIGLVKVNGGTKSIPFLWSRELHWNDKEQLWFGDNGWARFTYEDEGVLHSPASRHGGLGTSDR
jgi:hypothetical protein